MLDVSRTIQKYLHDKGHTDFISHAVGMEVEMVIWSDDLAIPVLTDTAEALMPVLLALIDFVRNEFARRGFQVNLAKGKPGVVATFCGHGAADLRRQYQPIPQPGLHHQFQDGTTSFVHLMPAYRHLGTLYTSDQQLDTEIAYRIGTATSACDQIKRRLLTNRHLPVRLRLQLFQSLVRRECLGRFFPWPSHLDTPLLHASLLQQALWNPGRVLPWSAFCMRRSFSTTGRPSCKSTFMLKMIYILNPGLQDSDMTSPGFMVLIP